MTDAPATPRVAYVMSRFPKLTETFILYEILAVRRTGVAVDVYPLIREREPTMHPEAGPVVAEAHYQPVLSPAIIRSNARALIRDPRRYLGTLAAVLRGVWGSLNFMFGALGIFPKVVHLARLMQESGVTHVHCHFANHPALAGFVIRRLSGIPYSFTAHGSDLHVIRHMLPQKVREAAFVVAISEFNRQVIVDECGPDAAAKVHVVHCGVDTDVFRPEPAAGDPPGLRILSIGTIHEVKGQPVLVEACRILADKEIDVRCQFVGDGPERAALQRTIDQAGMEDRIELLGRRDRSEVLALIRAADVLAAPSVPARSGKREGIPVVLMEAMSCGVPVVASRLSGIPELVEHDRSGLLVEPGDPEALATALATLAEDEGLRRRLGAAGRDAVVARFDLAANAGRLASLFGGVRV